MVKQKDTNFNVVNDYMLNLLMDTQLTSDIDEDSEPSLRFAKVEKGHEMVMLWREPNSEAQTIMMNLTILSLVKKLPLSRLKNAMLLTINRAVLLSR